MASDNTNTPSTVSGGSTTGAAGNTLASGVRKTPYDIGGQAPYGFLQTPGYNTQWVPELVPGFQIPAVQETALYQRMDWQSALDGYTNPPFIGIGSSTTAVPNWMNTDGTTMRILRGYIRRSWAHPITEPNLSDAQLATNARLYFMYNPSELTRQYVSYSALAGVATDNPDAATAGGQQVPALVTMDFELLFDRQEEVMRFSNHPGVLVDLSVFDMLIGNDATAVTNNSPDGAATPDQGSPLGAFSTLKPGMDIYLTIVVSPSITFEGRVWAAGAQFQKFSHRMTPTRMTVTLTLQLNYTGKLLPQGQLNAAAQASAASAAANNKTVGEVDPAQKAPSFGVAMQANFDGRGKAVAWGENWTPEAGIKVNGVPYDHWNPATQSVDFTQGPALGVMYWESKVFNRSFDRCDNAAFDDINLTDVAHQPGYFDCSSFVWRCFNVVHWVDALKLGTVCAASSEGFITAAQGNSDVWSIDSVLFGQAPSLDLTAPAKAFNTWDPQKTGQAGPNTGDVLIRKQTDKQSGHIAFIHSLVTQNNDPLQWRWKLLSIGEQDKPVSYGTITTQQIFQGGGGYAPYDYIARAHPVQY